VVQHWFRQTILLAAMEPIGHQRILPSQRTFAIFTRDASEGSDAQEPHMLTQPEHNHSNSLGSPLSGRLDASAELVVLRQDLALLVADVARLVEARSAQVKVFAADNVEAGLEASRNTIRAYPVTSIAVAAVIGATVAVMITSQPRRPNLSARLSHAVPNVTRADLAEMAHHLQRSASTAAHGSGLASAFERVVDSVSSIDAKSSLMPALEKAGAWLSSLRSSVVGK
jgi:hypothetical protein